MSSSNLHSQVDTILTDCFKNSKDDNYIQANKTQKIQHISMKKEGDFSTFLYQFESICNIFKNNMKPDQILLQKQIIIGQQILTKLDKLIDINVKMNENIEKINLDMQQKGFITSQPVLKSLFSLETDQVKAETPPVCQVNGHLEKVFQQMKMNESFQGELEQPKFEQCLQEMIDDIIIPTTNPLMQTISIPKLFAARSMIYPRPESDRDDIICTEGLLNQTTKQIGQQYIQDAQFYFKQYSQSRLTYDDMKIKFSQSMLYRMINHSEKWINYYLSCKQASQPVKGSEQAILSVFDSSTKQTLEFLINKYPPSRRRIIDTQLTQKIQQIKYFSIAKYDVLKNSGSLIGFNQNQNQFTKDIKLFLNKLIKQSKKQFPKFRNTMKQIFANNDGSIDGSKIQHHDVDYIIGSKISQSVLPYSSSQLDLPGIDIRNSEILRILMKWVEELQSYFTETNIKILENKFGFRTRLIENIPIKMPRSKKQTLAEKLRQIYNTEIQIQIQEHKRQMSILMFHLVQLGLSGIQKNQNLNHKQLVMLKISECLSQILRSSVISVLNIYLKQLVKIGTMYKSDEIESNLILTTFGIMDLLRCKCIGSKSEIYRIYNEIASNTEYFQIIRVKNKLNESTRDILINLKLKKSFIICEVQLSLGDSVQQVNDHFCHYLYELSRSPFGVLFECANQIWSLDPRMMYLKKNPNNVKFKSISPILNKLKSYFRSADFIYCSEQHPECAMKLQLNNKPYCCMNCSSFHSAYKSWLIHIECPKCFNSICFTCFNELKKKNQCLMYKYLKQNNQLNYMNNYIFSESYYSSIADPEKMIAEMKKLFVKYQYIAYVVINNVGNIITVKKRYKGSFIQAFSTLKQIQQVPISPALPYHWNAIIPLKNPITKKLSQLKSYRKLHIAKKWYEIQQILEQRNINEVVCIVDQMTKSVLVIDINESQQEIQQTLLQRQINKSIEQYNKINCGYFQLTSKGIQDIRFLSNIKQKQTITTLNLWQNKIQDISILKQFPAIEQLYLKQNKIQSIAPLLGMKHLTIMGLNWNCIKGEIPQMNFPYLQLLDISYLPQLTSIDNLSNSQLGSLMMIRANQTKIKLIPRLRLPNLTLLSIAHSQIQDISQLQYCQLPQLKKLCLNNNKIVGKVPIMPFHQLQFLQLQGNQITDLQNFSHSQILSLATLDLSNNKIQGKISHFRFPSLVTLNLKNNKISSYCKRLFISQVFKSLHFLDLSQNLIEELSQIKLLSLKTLKLNNNQLSKISVLSECELNHLQYLDMSNNLISSDLPFIRMPCLIEFQLQNNRLDSIRNLQNSKLPQLKLLNLSNNLISELPSFQMESLKILNLSNNKIQNQQIVDCLHLISGIEQINLKGNPVQLKDIILKKRKSLEIFKLQ